MLPSAENISRAKTRVGVAQVAQDEVSDDEQTEAAAVNYRRRVGPQQRPVAPSNKGNKAGRFSCFKPYHMKKECITCRNTEIKVFFTLILMPPFQSDAKTQV